MLEKAEQESMVSLIERNHANVLFCSNHDLGTALPPPSVGGLRRRGPVTWPFALPRPAPSRRPRAVLTRQWGSATPRPGAGAHTRQVEGSSVRARAHLPSRRRARIPQPSAELSVRHPARASLRARPRHSPSPAIPARLPSERSPGLPFSPSAPPLRCPGSGPSAPLVRLASLTVAPVSPRISAGGPSQPPIGEPAVAFGACSRRTSGSPSRLRFSGRS